MNKSYKTVWNETTGTYVAASEVARSKGKSSRNQKVLVTALLAAGVGFGMAVKAEAAATASSFAAGILGTNTSDSACISSADGATVTTNGDCSAATQQAGIVSYNSSGTAGAYFTVTDPDTAHIGAGGVDQMRITNSGVFMLNTLDMGGKKITNLAPGAVSASSTDAVNGAQLYGVTSLIAFTDGVSPLGPAKNTYPSRSQLAFGAGATVSNAETTAIGASASAAAIYSTAVGASANASNGQATALGNASVASGLRSTALGYRASSTGTGSVAIGQSSVATLDNTVSVGSSTLHRQIVNLAAGQQTTDAVNYGQLQAAGLKVDSSGNATNAFVAYDDTTEGKVTLGGASGTTLSNVAAGALSASSTDAVNGSQLYTTNQNVAQNTATMAQNTSDIATNAGNIAQNTTDIGTLNTQVGAMNSQMADVVKYDSSAHDTVALAGASGTTLTNLKAGALSASSTDAVNGSQLYATNTNVTNLQTTVNGLTTGNAGINYFHVNSVSQDSLATGTNAIAIGTGASASNSSAVAIGSSADSSGTSSIALGDKSIVSGNSSLALGYKTKATAADAVAIGSNSVADTANTVSVGAKGAERKIVNVAAGAVSASSTDAINGSQLYTTNQSVAQNTAAITQNTTDISTINSQLASLGGGVSGAVAYDSSTQDSITLAGASGTTITNLKAGALSASSAEAVNGSQLYTTNQNVAQNAAEIAQNTSDIAQNASDISTNANNIAQNTSDIATNTGNIAALDTRVTNVEGSVSDLAKQLNSGTVGLVQQDALTGDLTVAAGTGGSAINFAGVAGARQLFGVAAGTTATSAVNLGQLSPVVAALGGGAQVNADGSIVSPTYHMQGGTQTTVGDALDTLDTNLSSLETQINNGSIGMVTQDQTSRDILVGATTDGLRVNMAGTAGNRVVTGVAAGAVNATSNDAVNGAQLYSHAAGTAAALGGGSTVNEDGTISAPVYTVGGTTVNNVGAALTNIDGRVTQNTSDIASLQSTVGTMSTSVANAVQYDSAAHNQVTMGGSADAPKVKLTNLQEGELSATSSDAVTGAQLWNTNQQLSDLSQSVQNQQQTGSAAMSLNTGGAPAAVASGTNAVALGGGSQASGENSVAIGAGSVADQANTLSVGSQGNERRITNVAPGKSATDAVNLGQMQSAVGETARAAYSGVAAATALTMIPEVDPGKTLAIGVAGATYKGYQAAAVGASARITSNVKVKVGAGISGSETTVGAGASYQW
ncbi:YadA-like family protein [Paraburkholderia haematera]|uniref:Head domain of trimeric autotransporter adhesin n=1 Tax=Paraburkholderia haematera TaxID=2793077 RepID=A0ABN7M1Q7_9BURK|nr:YadA-like family protein [Paraburkholderia haematera]CAE6776257.1 hypothetical protein R69888_04090 [Paraburkholderia haematera]